MARETLNIQDIKKILPHRYPFLLVDAVRDIRVGESAVGIKNVTVNEPFFAGHFPERPIFPGVLIIEALAQTAAVLVGETVGFSDQSVEVYFMSVDKTKFRKPVEPGDVLELHVQAIKSRDRIWRFACEARVAGKRVAESEITAMFEAKDLETAG